MEFKKHFNNTRKIATDYKNKTAHSVSFKEIKHHENEQDL